MKPHLPLLLLPLFYCVNVGWSQDQLKGVVRSSQTGLPMVNVSVRNLNSKKVTLTNGEGRYSIAAAEDDSIIFSITAYFPDTIKLTYGQLLTSYDPELLMDMKSLKNVTVRSNYGYDSLRRASDYKELTDRMRGITGGNRPTDGVGVSLSPLSYFSQRAKKQRKARRNMESREEEAYVDDKFSAFNVARLTRLQGDSLSLFMYMYRPSYKQARKMDRDDITEYISEKLVMFRQRSREEE
ncbi:MAG: hypothetical protein EOO09_02335 [Chitinophagaceae bacterium]|nr:MAG: hypothetical protein EOO09_02335 [Chitinophagaceae bacterium]